MCSLGLPGIVWAKFCFIVVVVVPPPPSGTRIECYEMLEKLFIFCCWNDSDMYLYSLHRIWLCYWAGIICNYLPIDEILFLLHRLMITQWKYGKEMDCMSQLTQWNSPCWAKKELMIDSAPTWLHPFPTNEKARRPACIICILKARNSSSYCW